MRTNPSCTCFFGGRNRVFLQSIPKYCFSESTVWLYFTWVKELVLIFLPTASLFLLIYPTAHSFTIVSIVNFLVLFKIIKYKWNKAKKSTNVLIKRLFLRHGGKVLPMLPQRVPCMLSLNDTSLSEGQRKKNLHFETEIINEKWIFNIIQSAGRF